MQGWGDNYKRYNIHINGNKRRRREKGIEEISKTTTTEDLTKLMSETKPQTQEAQRTPSGINAKDKSIPWHIIIKLQKI